MSKLLVLLLAVLVVVEAIAVIGIAGALFWLGGRGSTVVASSMLVVTVLAGFLALRSARSRR